MYNQFSKPFSSAVPTVERKEARSWWSCVLSSRRATASLTFPAGVFAWHMVSSVEDGWPRMPLHNPSLQRKSCFHILALAAHGLYKSFTSGWQDPEPEPEPPEELLSHPHLWGSILLLRNLTDTLQWNKFAYVVESVPWPGSRQTMVFSYLLGR